MFLKAFLLKQSRGFLDLFDLCRCPPGHWRFTQFVNMAFCPCGQHCFGRQFIARFATGRQISESFEFFRLSDACCLLRYVGAGFGNLCMFFFECLNAPRWPVDALGGRPWVVVRIVRRWSAPSRPGLCTHFRQTTAAAAAELCIQLRQIGVRSAYILYRARQLGLLSGACRGRRRNCRILGVPVGFHNRRLGAGRVGALHIEHTGCGLCLLLVDQACHTLNDALPLSHLGALAYVRCSGKHLGSNASRALGSCS